MTITFHCPSCDVTFDRMLQFKNHLKTKKHLGIHTNYTCNLCNKNFGNKKDNFNKHRCTGLVSKCDHCNKNFKNKKSFQNHSNVCKAKKKNYFEELNKKQKFCDYFYSLMYFQIPRLKKILETDKIMIKKNLYEYQSCGFIFDIEKKQAFATDQQKCKRLDKDIKIQYIEIYKEFIKYYNDNSDLYFEYVEYLKNERSKNNT